MAEEAYADKFNDFDYAGIFRNHRLFQSIADFLYLSWHLLRSFFMSHESSGARDRGDAPADCRVESRSARGDSEGKDAARSSQS